MPPQAPRHFEAAPPPETNSHQVLPMQQGPPHFEHLVEVEERMLENIMALHDKFDTLNLGADGQGGAIMYRPAAEGGFGHMGSLEQNMLAMNQNFTEEIRHSMRMMSDNMTWMKGAIQRQVMGRPEPSATINSSPGGGAYTIAVTGASLIIQTPHMPTYNSQPEKPPDIPGAVSHAALGNGDQSYMNFANLGNAPRSGSPAGMQRPSSASFGQPRGPYQQRHRPVSGSGMPH